ncbi:MAG: hypothetical protein V3T70_00355, partial [Phycisphaerae bacterium]
EQLDGIGWQCRAVLPSARGVWRMVIDRGIRHVVRDPAASDKIAHLSKEARPFGEWQPDLVHVFGADLISAAGMYATPPIPTILSVNDDTFLHALTSHTPSGADARECALRRAAAFTTPACALYADLCRVFGEQRVFLIEEAALVARQAPPKTSSPVRGAADSVVVFLDPHDPLQTATFLSAVKHLESRGSAKGLFQVVPTSDARDVGGANAFHLACNLQNSQSQVEFLATDSDWLNCISGAQCVTFLGPADSTPPEVAAAIALGIWVIAAPPCEFIGADPAAGELLDSLDGAALADAWARRPSGRANAPSVRVMPTLCETAAALSRVYRQCLQ